MKRSEIRTRVRVYIDEAEAERWEDSALNSLIDQAAAEAAAFIMSLEDSYYIKSSSFSIDGVNELYNLPTDFQTMKEVVDENGDPITRCNPSDRHNYISTGETRRYYFQGSQIGFLDVPGSAQTYPYKYVRIPTAMADDNASPDTPVFLVHDFIAVLAAIDALDIDEEMDTYLTRKRKNLIRQITEVYCKRNADHPEVIPEDDELELDD